jgi:L-fucose isomerase-like protein
VLLAHPSQNSFPARLEILARLQQQGRRGEIVFLDDGEDGDRALRHVAAAAAARARLAGRRLGCVGAPSDWLVASLPTAAAVAGAWGVELVDVDLPEVLDAVRAVPAAETAPLIADLLGAADAVVEPAPADLQDAAAVLVALRAVFARHDLHACTVRCFDLVTRLRTTGCYALSRLNDEDLIAGCEGDVPSTLTMMWLHALAGEVPFMANPQQVDVPGGRLWLSHCTIGRSLLEGYRVRSHFESGLGVAIEGRLAPQPVTIARIGGADVRQVFVADGRVTWRPTGACSWADRRWTCAGASAGGHNRRSGAAVSREMMSRVQAP